MKLFYKIIISIIITICVVSNTHAQRPKVGLTLSGGGAKGLAHVGILQAIDSAGLKIDYITGTSMGSIIGAMYATGYSGNQIDSITKLINWNELLSGKPKYTDVGIDEKDEFGKYSFEIPFDGTKSKMGTGLIESEEIWLEFSEIFFHVYDKTDFSEFSIPFKCIATDLSTGNAVVLDTGQIVKALRSSMAIPSILTSVEYGNTQLVDGGIVRNFPVSDVLNMGADYTIGVNLFSGLVDANDLNSVIDVMYQITNYRDADDLVEQKKLCNILIEPPVSDYSAGSFDESDAILDIGYEMREKYYPIFKRIADSLNRIQKVSFNPKTRLNSTKKVIIDSYNFVGLNTLSEDMIIKKSRLKLGQEYSAKELNEAFRHMYSTLNFQYIYYELIPVSKGHAKMKIVLKEQYYGMFKLAFNYHTFTTPSIILNYTWRNLIFNKSRSLFKFALSQDVKARLEHKQFFGKKLDNTITFYTNYTQQRIPFYNSDGGLEYQYKTSIIYTDVSVHKYFGRNTAVGISAAYRVLGFSPDIASVYRFDGYNNGFALTAKYEYNSLNRPILPTQGAHVTINSVVDLNKKYSAHYSGSDTTISDTTFTLNIDDPQYRIGIKGDFFQSLSSKLTLITNVQGAFMVDVLDTPFDNIFIGGSQLV